MSELIVTLSNGNEITAHRVNNSMSGNPRYVVHFKDITESYDKAISLAKKIGGSRYRAAWFGGGVVFESYNLKETLDRLISLTK